MNTRITIAEITHVIALLRTKLIEAGLGAWEIEPWLAKATARLTRDLHDGTCAYFLEYHNGEPIAMAGALLRHDAAFLSLKAHRYGCVVDEYVLPAHRNHGLEPPLRAHALAWIAEATARTETAIPPNAARLAASSGGGKL